MGKVICFRFLFLSASNECVNRCSTNNVEHTLLTKWIEEYYFISFSLTDMDEGIPLPPELK